ncbi:MAG: ABC transporter permease, partial [Asticcacaulis sp.]|nr:ABC transporter permease [Asticcacaulis sp.]
MIRSALQSFYRSLLRHPLYAGINLLGLAFGIAVFILLSLFVQFETGYDTWLPGSDHVYAVTYNARIRKAEHQPARYMSAAYVLDAVRRLYPELTGTRIDGDYMNIRLGGRVVAEEGNSVDKAFFHVFDIPVIAGDREAALDAPDGLILSERMARKYFATTDVIGRTLIIRDEPGPLALRPRQTVPHNAYWFAWSSQFRIRTYFRLDARDHRRLEAGLVPAIKAYPLDDDQARSYFKHFFDDTEIALQPYSSEHLADPRVRRAIAAIDMAGVLAFVVSLINYVNLATARGGIRAREVAIRKTAGATRPRLVAQFLSEALLLGTAAMAIAFSLVELSLPVLNHLGHLSLRLDYWRDSPTLLALAAAVLAGSAIAGLYPAVVLSGFHPAQGLSATRTPAGGRIGHIVREILAVVQFIAASAFFIIIAGLAAQVRHMETAELGFARDGLLITDAMITRLMPPEKALAIQDAWRRTPGIVAVAAGPVPGRYFIAPRWRFRTDGRADEIDMQMAWMEGDFFAAYRTGRLAGRLLNADDDLGRLGIDPVVADLPHAKITANAVINLSAVRSLGFVSPAAAVGRTVTLGQAVFRVVGVVADQRFKAPTQKQMPFLYVYSARCVVE